METLSVGTMKLFTKVQSTNHFQLLMLFYLIFLLNFESVMHFSLRIGKRTNLHGK